jgi:hypothetical protein
MALLTAISGPFSIIAAGLLELILVLDRASIAIVNLFLFVFVRIPLSRFEIWLYSVLEYKYLPQKRFIPLAKSLLKI